ncbi:hypothetical protein ACU686_37365 [Yinghuangia aomiensis]
MDMLANYLNRYAFAVLNPVDRKEWDAAYESGDSDAYCNLFGVRKLVLGIKPFHEQHSGAACTLRRWSRNTP